MSDSVRNKVLHNRNPSIFTGDYEVTDDALKRYNVQRKNFGTTEIELPTNTFNVKNFHYVLDNGDVGMHLIPVNDYGIIKGTNNETFWASQLIDTYIRNKQGIKEDDPLYAFIYYIHPELSKITIADFATTDINEMGITHMGAYYGQGVTTNAPPLYHHRRWGVAGTEVGYPCNVLTLSMQGTDQAMLNKNFILVDKFLNYGVRFPIDYKHSAFRMVDINTCLMFYRDWIMEKSYLKQDTSWFTYCAAHKTLVTTVALNLTHNEKSFMEVYGEEEGKEFYQLFIKNYFELAGERFIEDDHGETDFEPLWKKEGFSPQHIKPFTYEEYLAYDTARREGRLDSFKGFKPLKPTQATGWGPQFAADVIMDFVEAYADFIDAGAVISCATIMGYAEQVIVRMGISMEEYLMAAMPIVEAYMEAHAKIYAPVNPEPSYKESKYYIETFAALYIAYGGKKENLQKALHKTEDLEQYEGDLKGFIAFLVQQKSLLPEFLAWWSLWKVRTNWKTIVSAPSLLPIEAYAWLKDTVREKFEHAGDLVAPEADAIQYNTPPAIGHMIGIGMFDKNPLITLKTICTVMDHSELEPKV